MQPIIASSYFYELGNCSSTKKNFYHKQLNFEGETSAGFQHTCVYQSCWLLMSNSYVYVLLVITIMYKYCNNYYTGI